MKPSWGARALICAGVTDDDDDDDGLTGGTVVEAALFIAGVTDGVELADRAVVLALLPVGACDDDGGDGPVGGAG